MKKIISLLVFLTALVVVFDSNNKVLAMSDDRFYIEVPNGTSGVYGNTMKIIMNSEGYVVGISDDWASFQSKYGIKKQAQSNVKMFTIRLVDPNTGIYVEAGRGNPGNIYTGYINVYLDSNGNITTFSDDWNEFYYHFALEYQNQVDENEFTLETRPVKVYKPAISGQDILVLDVDKKYSVDEIIAMAKIKVTDEYDGNITSKLKVVSNEYLGSENTTGTYDVKFSATNTSNFTTEFTLKVNVRDLKAPVITGPEVIKVPYTKTINKDTILNYFQISDNYDNTLTKSIDLTSYKVNTIKTFDLEIVVEDASKNITKKEIKLEVFDDVKPTITDLNEGIIELNWKEEFTENKLLLNFEANDEIDGDLTKKISITKNNLTNKIGEYQVTYEVVDNAGNTTSINRTYKVVSTSYPEFFVSLNILNIEKINTLTSAQLADILASYNNINLASFEVVENEYENNENTAGHYNLKLRLIDTTGEIHEVSQTINVFDAEDLPEINNPSFFDKVVLFFLNLFKNIGKFIKKCWNSIFK